MAMSLKAGIAQLSLALSSGCASTTFTPATASGAPSRVVEGIEFFETTAPTRPYTVLGEMQDERYERGGVAGMMISGIGQYSTIARKAKTAGGDAVVLVSADRQAAGARVNQDGTVHVDHINARRFVVIKWK
jgi:hypothetical protein